MLLTTVISKIVESNNFEIYVRQICVRHNKRFCTSDCPNLLSANPTKWSNRLKQFVALWPTNAGFSLVIYGSVFSLALIHITHPFLSWKWFPQLYRLVETVWYIIFKARRTTISLLHKWNVLIFVDPPPSQLNKSKHH